MPRDYRRARRRDVVDALPGRSRRRRRLAWLVILGILGAGGASLVWFRPVLMPFIISAVMVYLLSPLVDRLASWRVPRWLGVLLSYLGVLLVFYLFFLYLVPMLEKESKKLFQNLHRLALDAPRHVRDLERGVEEVLGQIVSDDDAQTSSPPPELRWGQGPSIEPLALASPVTVVPHLEALRLSGGADEESERLALRERRGEAAQGEEARSTLVVKRLRDGQYGVILTENSVEVEPLGDGRFNISARAGRQSVSTVAGLREQVIDALRSGLEEIGGGIIRGVVGVVQSVIGGVVGALIAIIVTFMVAAFVLIDLPRLRQFLRARIPARYMADYAELMGRLDAGLSGVVRGQLLVCLFNGALSFVGFSFLIPEYAVVMAILGGVMSIIPILGTIIATVPAVLVGLTVDWQTSLGVFAWVMGVHFIEANLLSPKIVSNQAKIHPALIMFAIIAGQQMFGIKGALLAVPVASILKSLVSFAYPRAERIIMGRSER